MIPATVRIFVCPEPQDMRRSFDGLALAAPEHLGEDPQGGAVFVFCNKRRDRLKALWFDANGYCILYKRLHRAHFAMPDRRTIEPRALAMLLRGVDSAPRRSLRR
ncbi:MAG: IS66 family insertion sequence element accessory protein TnpB [Myxococcales bacterium]|nr:IS66 family insertion sequence element accessory protein TnpB [Myxococcales bacterium]